MEVNISDNTEKPFNGIRFSIVGPNIKVKADTENTLIETMTGISEVENKDDNIQTDD